MTEVRLTVTYPATDGSMPETAEVVWADVPDTDALVRVLDRLLAAPAERLYSRSSVSVRLPDTSPQRLPRSGDHPFVAAEYIPAGSKVGFSSMGSRALHLQRDGVTSPAGFAVDSLEKGDEVVQKESDGKWRKEPTCG